MDIGTMVVLILAAAMIAIAHFRGGEVATAGWRRTLQAIRDFLPLFVGIFIFLWGSSS